MSWIKVIIINLVLFFALMGAMLLAPPLVVKIYRIFQQSSIADRVSLPNYKNVSWIKPLTTEYSQLSRKYNDFVVWRTRDFNGDHINVENGIRRTVGIETNKNSKTWFFGGSSMWGFGVNNINTIPSLYMNTTGISASNFGELGYISRQSLAQLHNNYLQGLDQDVIHKLVVFLDGVNDVLGFCRIDSSALGTFQESLIQSNVSVQFTYEKTFQQLMYFISNLFGKLKITKNNITEYNCDTEIKRAEEIALRLVKVWEVAAALAERNGDNFVAILQPVAYAGNPSLNHLPNIDPDGGRVRKQYEAVYPLIKKYAANSHINFIDLTTAYDSCLYCYIDFCHVSHNANKIFVDKFIESLANYELMGIADFKMFVGSRL